MDAFGASTQEPVVEVVGSIETQFELAPNGGADPSSQDPPPPLAYPLWQLGGLRQPSLVGGGSASRTGLGFSKGQDEVVSQEVDKLGRFFSTVSSFSLPPLLFFYFLSFCFLFFLIFCSSCQGVDQSPAWIVDEWAKLEEEVQALRSLAILAYIEVCKAYFHLQRKKRKVANLRQERTHL